MTANARTRRVIFCAVVNTIWCCVLLSVVLPTIMYLADHAKDIEANLLSSSINQVAAFGAALGAYVTFGMHKNLVHKIFGEIDEIVAARQVHSSDRRYELAEKNSTYVTLVPFGFVVISFLMNAIIPTAFNLLKVLYTHADMDTEHWFTPVKLLYAGCTQ